MFFSLQKVMSNTILFTFWYSKNKKKINIDVYTHRKLNEKFVGSEVEFLIRKVPISQNLRSSFAPCLLKSLKK